MSYIRQQQLARARRQAAWRKPAPNRDRNPKPNPNPFMKTKNTNRIKLATCALKTRTDVESTLNEIVLTTINRNRALLAMDAEIAAARARHEETINACNKALEENTDLIRAWSEANPSEFKGLKSLDLVHAIIGWRTATPSLKTLAGWTWDRVLEKLKSLHRVRYIRTKEEVNKAQLLQDRELLTPEELREMGLRVLHEETFFIEPKLTEPDNRQQQAA